MILTTILSLLFSFGCAQAAVQASLKLPVPELETLPNGLQLAWFLNDSLPVVDLALLVKSGERDDPTGKAGTAELVASSLDRGAAGLSAQDLARAVEMLGASRYATADEDTFSVGMHGLAPDAPALLDLLAKESLRPDFPEAEVAREHDRMLDRWRHIGDYGASLAGLAFQRALAAGTIYGRGGFLSAKEFQKVSRDDVVAYYKENFTPKNAVLMIVGRVDRADFRRKIQASFGDWKGEAPVHERRTYADPRIKFQKGEVLLVDRPGLTQAEVRIGFRAPSIHAPEHYALTVANALLGEYFNSRLNSLIRDKLALTYSIGSAFNYSKELADFSISSATRNASVGQLVRKSVEVLRDVKKGEVVPTEVRMAKEYLLGGFPLSTSTLGAVASRWLAGYVFDLGPDYLNEFMPKVNEVTPEQVISALSKDLDLDHLVIAVAGDAKEILPGLKEAGFKSIKRVAVKDLQ